MIVVAERPKKLTFNFQKIHSLCLCGSRNGTLIKTASGYTFRSFETFKLKTNIENNLKFAKVNEIDQKNSEKNYPQGAK